MPRLLTTVFILAVAVFAAERSAAAEQTMADILPADACRPCHQTVPKLKLLPRDVKTLLKEGQLIGDEKDLLKALQEFVAPVSTFEGIGSRYSGNAAFSR
jgi:hypothetical protein